MKHLPSAPSGARLAVIALAALLARPAVGQATTPTFVQGTAFSTGDRVLTTTVTLTSPVAGGDLLVGWFSQYNDPGQVQVSDDVNGAWTRAPWSLHFLDDTGDIALYYRENSQAAPGGMTVTVSAASAAYLQGTVADYSASPSPARWPRSSLRALPTRRPLTPVRLRQWMRASSCSRPC